MKRKSPVKAKRLESVIQGFVDGYLDSMGYACIRIPDALFRQIYAQQSVPIQVKTIVARSLGGLPDNVVCQRIEGTPFFLGCAIENKSDVGRLGPKQQAWQRKLNTNIVRKESDLTGLLKIFEKYIKELNNSDLEDLKEEFRLYTEKMEG